MVECFENVQKVFQDIPTATIDLHFGQYNNLKGVIMSVLL